MKNIDDMDIKLDFRRGIDPNSLYELSALLGEGSYGAVYRGKLRDVEGAADVAIKIIPDADDDLTSLWREIRFLQVLRSPYVVSFIESLLFDNELWLVMELCDGGSLYDLKEANKGKFTEPELQAIMAYCTLGLAHLHAQLSIHRDVKSGNILLTRDGRAKLGDFGISAQLTDTIMKRRTVIGSPYWMAPEVIQETSYDGKADIWSLGITLLELCEGSPPHFNIHPMRAIFMISSKAAPTLQEPELWSSDMKSFIGRCLIKNCEERATAAELLKHPWINSTIKEITKNESKGLAILEKLVSKHSDTMEKLRSSRFHPPDMANNNTLGNGNANISNDQKEISNMNTINNYNSKNKNMDTIRNSNNSSSYSQNNMATLRQNTINKQQLRNASLTKPANSRGFDYGATLKNEANGSGEYNDGTCIIRPQRNFDNSGSNYHSDDKDKTMKFSPMDDKDGTLRVKSSNNYSSSSSINNSNTFVNFNDNYYNGNNNNATLIRSNSFDPNATIRPGAPNSNSEGRSDMHSALKYFQGDTLVSSLPSGALSQAQSDAKRTTNNIGNSDKKSTSETYSSSATSSNFYLPELEIHNTSTSANDVDASLGDMSLNNNSENHEKIKNVSL